jgi:predicted glutamine amidotransferase
MCGIAGVMRLGAEPISHEQLKVLLLGVQHRGMDATGIAVLRAGKVTVHKSDDPAWKFITQKDTEKFLQEYVTPETDVVTLHTRAATKGDPRQNDNNHPMFAGHAAVVHNGMIHNDDDLFKELKVKRYAETDSDIIRAIVDKDGMTKKGIRTLNRLRGSAACGIISSDFPTKLMLLRAGSPLVLARTEEYLMWASEKDPLHKAARIWHRYWGIEFQSSRPMLSWHPVETSTAFLIDFERLRQDPNTYEAWHDEFDICSYYNRPTYRGYDGFAAKQTSKKLATKHTERSGAGKVQEWCKPCHGWHEKGESCPKEEHTPETEGTGTPTQSPIVVTGAHLALGSGTTSPVIGPAYLRPVVLNQRVQCPKCKREYTCKEDVVGKFLWDLFCKKCDIFIAQPPKELVH